MTKVRERLEKMLLLVPYALQHPELTASDLCRQFGLTRRELTKDLEVLFLCGLPDYGPGDLIFCALEDDRVHIEMADYLARPVRLTAGEAFSLLLAVRIAGNLVTGSSVALDRAEEKIRGALSLQELGDLSELEERVAIPVQAELPAGRAAELSEAITDHRSLVIAYRAVHSGEITHRTLDPYYLLLVYGNWYLIAYCHTRNDLRIFRLDGILDLKVTDRRFERREELIPSHLLEGETVYLPGPEDRTVRLGFSSKVAQWVRDSWPGEQVEALPDGGCVLTLKTSKYDWLIRRLLQHVSEVVSLEPEDLREAFLGAVRRLKGLYEGRAAETVSGRS